MKFFKLKYGERKEKVIRLSSIEFLNLVASKTPIWQQTATSNRRKSLANETKRECWRQIARKLVGRPYLDAKVKDRLEIEQGLKSRFHAMRDQWVKCRNRNKLYAFEDQIKFLDTRQDFASVDELKFEFDSESGVNSKMYSMVSEEDMASHQSDEYEDIEHVSMTEAEVEEETTTDEMQEEHIQIEIANIITEFPPSPISAEICTEQAVTECSERVELPAEALTTLTVSSPPSPSPLSPVAEPLSPASDPPPYCKKFNRPESSMSYSCSCHCHKDEVTLKHRENDLFGKAIATLLNNMDGEKLFETKKAILSCIVRDMFIEDPEAPTSSSSSSAAAAAAGMKK